MVELLIEYKEGIIGIVGAMIGLIASECLRRCGKVKFIKENIEAKFCDKLTSDGLGGFKNPVIGKDGAERFECELDLQVYNGKEIPQVYNKISIVFKDGKRVVVTSKLESRESFKKVAGHKEYEIIESLTIDAKSLTSEKWKFETKDNIEDLKNGKMYLRYMDVATGKVKEVFILDLKDLD